MVCYGLFGFRNIAAGVERGGFKGWARGLVEWCGKGVVRRGGLEVLQSGLVAAGFSVKAECVDRDVFGADFESICGGLMVRIRILKVR